jgi:biopolymer transport protein ExbB
MFPIAWSRRSALAIAIERYVTLTRLGLANRRAWTRLQPTLAARRLRQGARADARTAAPRCRGARDGSRAPGAVRRREDVEVAMEESMMEIVPQLEKRTHYLATFANLATLLGLLGTGSGLIHAFGGRSPT